MMIVISAWTADYRMMMVVVMVMKMMNQDDKYCHKVGKGITKLFDTHVRPIFRAVDFENKSREMDIDRFVRID